MEITRSNITEKLAEVGDAINEATFLSFDCEFTGLDAPGSSHIGAFDTPEERYMKLREGSLDFLLVQFGVCAFKFKEDTKSYEARPFNFYIFPRPYTRQAPDRRFLCQSSSIDFLVQQGFDFNKLFREGIPYLTPVQEEAMRCALNSKHQEFAKFSSPAFLSPDGADMGPAKGPIQIPDEQKDFIADICEKISNFVDTASDSDALQLDPCNGFQRKLIYQTIRSKFSSVHLETKTGEKKQRFIVVTKVASDEELKKKEKEKQNAEIMELEEAVGFGKVMKLIAQCGKIMVGHNMLLDVMHTLNQFCQPLPQQLDEFKSMTRCILPRLVDTKLMASTHPLRDIIPNTVLANLQQTLEKEPFTPAKVELPEGFQSYRDATDKHHEAGYDAYVTGCLFATMTTYLANTQNSTAAAVVEPTPALVEPFLNKLFLMRINDIPYLNLGGPDLQPNRDHVFHLTFPRDWRAQDINNLFAPYGNIHISWLSDSSAFVALYKKDNAAVVLKALSETRMYQLVPYKVYKASIAPPPPPALLPVPTQPSAAPATAGVKRPAPAAEEGVGEDGQGPIKRRRPSDASSGATAVVMEDSEIPELVSRTQPDTAPLKDEDAAKASGMFPVPSDW